MTDFRDVLDRNLFQQGFTDSDGELRTIEVKYTTSGGARILDQLHISSRLEGTTVLEAFRMNASSWFLGPSLLRTGLGITRITAMCW